MTGIVDYVVETAGDGEVRVRVTDAAGSTVAEASGSSGSLSIADATLWQPGAAYLYDLTAESRGRRDRRGRVSPAGRHPHRRSAGCGVPHQRRAVLLHRIRQARGRRGPRQGTRQRLPRARLRAAGLDRRELVPHRALPLRRRGARVRGPARDRRHRRDRRGRPQPLARRGHHRCTGAADLLARHDQRRHPCRARAAPARTRRARQEPPERRDVVHRERAGFPGGGRSRVLRTAHRSHP